jgi:putative PIN family toxin of toxin-antitoxin system
MEKRKARVILDTNVLISSFVFGGNPREILELVKNKEVEGLISPTLLAELGDVLAKKFQYPKERILQAERKLKKIFKIIHPVKLINAVADDADNRVLEAAVEGRCGYIVTGDKDLLTLKDYRGIKITTPSEFLKRELSWIYES